MVLFFMVSGNYVVPFVVQNCRIKSRSASFMMRQCLLLLKDLLMNEGGNVALPDLIIVILVFAAFAITHFFVC